jgi:APA family basic amino acid/polyamine antiporter
MNRVSSPNPGDVALRRRSLLKVLGVWEGAAIGIGVAIGAGIFRTPGYVAGFLSTPWAILGIWILGWLIVLGDTLILSELATRIPRAGGWYVYIEKGWGRFPAFIYGWVFMLIIDPASSAALVVVLGEYLSGLLGLAPTAGRILAIGMTLGLFGLAMAGIRLGSRVQDALTYTKLFLLAAVGILAFLLPRAAGAAPGAIPHHGAGFLSVGLALQGVLWTFEGYANTTTMAEESVDPRRTLPRALIGTALVLGATYLLVNAAYLHVLGRDRLAASQLPAGDMVSAVFGRAGESVFLILAIFTALGSLNGAALSAPRVAYALSRTGSAPEPLTRVSRVGTPDLATLWFAAAWTLYAWFGSFEGLISVSIFIGALANVLVTGSLFRLRRQGAGGGNVFLCPGYPWVPVLMLAVWGGFAFAVLYDQKMKVGYGLAVMVLSAPVYLLMNRRRTVVPDAA